MQKWPVLLLLGCLSQAVAQSDDGNGSWNSRDQAARRGLTDAATASREYQGRTGTAVEYGGWVYENSDGSYGYTTPDTSGHIDRLSGLADSAIANLPGGDAGDDYVPRLNSGERVVGFYHNHPNHFGYDPEHFSSPDLDYAERFNVPIFLVTPQNEYKKYDPDNNDPDSFDYNHDDQSVEDHVDDDEARAAHAEGEPHIGTHDGRLFDFQAAGEFLAIEADGLVVMLRFEKLAAYSFVSVVTGVSIASGNDRIGVYAASPQLMINGEVTVADREMQRELAGGMKVSGDGDKLEIRTSNGDRITVRNRYSEWLDTDFALTESRFGAVRGLLGNLDRDPANDFVTRAGDPVDVMSGDARERRNKLYRTWGASWQISEAESIFDYVHGKTAADYRYVSSPEPAPSYADLLQRPDSAAAIRRCREAGVTQMTALQRCVFDLLVTGDERFIASYIDEAIVNYKAAVAADDGSPWVDQIETAGESAALPIVVREGGQQLFVIQERFDHSLDLVKVGLYNGDGEQVAVKCFGCGHIGLFSVDEPGRYIFRAGGARETATGSFALRYWFVLPPDRFDVVVGEKVTPGMPGPGAGSIERPGAADEYRFSVAAPTTVTVHVSHYAPALDLVAWSIIDSNGNRVREKCLGCGADETVVLELAGDYTLRVGTTDREAGTGRYGLSLSLGERP